MCLACPDVCQDSCRVFYAAISLIPGLSVSGFSGFSQNGANRRPVSDSATPALGIALLRCLADRGAFNQDDELFAAVTRGRCHEPDRAVVVLMVVPLHEGVDSVSGCS